MHGRLDSQSELQRQIRELVALRERRRDELVAALIAADSITDRIDVLLERLRAARS